MSLPANFWASACEASVSLRTGNGGLKPTLLAVVVAVGECERLYALTPEAAAFGMKIPYRSPA